MKKILLIIDAQNDFIDGALRNEDAINYAVPNIINKLKKHGSDYDAIVFTQDTHDKDYLSTKEGNKLPVEHCIFGTEGWQIHPEIRDLVTKIHLENNLILRSRFLNFKCISDLKYRRRTHREVTHIRIVEVRQCLAVNHNGIHVEICTVVAEYISGIGNENKSYGDFVAGHHG